MPSNPPWTMKTCSTRQSLRATPLFLPMVSSVFQLFLTLFGSCVKLLLHVNHLRFLGRLPHKLTLQWKIPNSKSAAGSRSYRRRCLTRLRVFGILPQLREYSVVSCINCLLIWNYELLHLNSIELVHLGRGVALQHAERGTQLYGDLSQLEFSRLWHRFSASHCC